MVRIVETPTRLIVNGAEAELAKLRERFRYHPESYWRSDAYQLWKVTDGKRGWDGYRYPLQIKADGSAEILRGRKDELIDMCRAERFETDTDRCLVSPFSEIQYADVTDDLIDAPFQLDDNQKQAVVEWLKYGMGVANMAVNAGKTATFACAAALIKRRYPDARFLYFTPSERLVTQVHTNMTQFLPGWEISKYGGGKHDRDGKDMVVATQAILTRHFEELVETKWFIKFHALLLDESHHCQSPTAEKVIRACVGYFRLGASDSTKEGDPEKWNRIQGLCGPVRIVVSSSELISSGRSAAPHLYLVDVPEWKGKFAEMERDPQEKTSAWTMIDGKWVKAVYLGPVYELDKHGNIKMKMRARLKGEKFVKEEEPVTKKHVHRLLLPGNVEYEAPASFTLLDRRYDKAIMRFKERNQMILEWAEYYSAKGWRTVVVATRTPHIIVLDSILQTAMGNLVRPLIGDSTAAERNAAFKWFKATPGAVLITSIVKEGVSINEIKAGIVADPVADWELAKQIIGRFMREKAENTCHITWFCDTQHPRYVRNFREVMSKLERIEGFTFYHPVAGPETIGQALIHKGHL